jgi:dipeptidyl aminopeptidase/acylaminoacyl peptidase
MPSDSLLPQTDSAARVCDAWAVRSALPPISCGAATIYAEWHDPSINNTPSWSPDSQKVVFWSDREGTPAIFVVNRDGSGLLNLTHGSGLDAQFPSWSPDGTRIVFMAVPVETGIAAFLSDNGGVLLGALLGALVLAALLVLALRRHRKTT